MFKNLLFSAAIKALQVALCTFYGLCMDQEDCPDGICDDALSAIDNLGESSPEPVASPGKAMAFDFNFQWDKLQPLVEATVAVINALKAFLGLNRVG